MRTSPGIIGSGDDHSTVRTASFPSDHATVSGAIAGGLWLTRRRIRYIAVGLAFLMAFIRVYVGAHYPGDVIAGLAFGGLLGLIGGRYVIPLIQRILDRLQPSAVGRLISARPAYRVDLIHPPGGFGVTRPRRLQQRCAPVQRARPARRRHRARRWPGGRLLRYRRWRRPT